jgi:hypothetical protein
MNSSPGPVVTLLCVLGQIIYLLEPYFFICETGVMVVEGKVGI